MTDGLEKIISLGLSGGILLQAYFVSRRAGTWLCPASLWGVFWFVYTFLPLVAIPAAPANAWAMLYILVACLVFSLSGYFWNWPEHLWENGRKKALALNPYETRFIHRVFIASSVAAILAWIANSIVQGFTLSDLVFNFFESAGAYSALRNREELTPNAFVSIANVCTYLGVTLGGFVYQRAAGRLSKAGVVALSFVPSVFVMLTQSSKGMFFLAASMFYAAILLSRLQGGDLRLLGRNWYRPALLVVAIAFPIVTVSFLQRGLYGELDSEVIIRRLVEYFASYSSGHLYAFSDWFASQIGLESTQAYFKEDRLTFGFYTATPLFRLFGSAKLVPAGVFDEYFKYGDILTTNIYTFFRGAILDFGLGGSLAFVFAAGWVCHALFRSLLQARIPTASAAGYVTMVGYFYTSYVVSLLIWSSVYLAFVMIWAVLAVNAAMLRSESRVGRGAA